MTSQNPDAEPAIQPGRAKRRFRWTSIGLTALICLFGLGVVLYISKPVEVRITETLAQSALDPKIDIPIEGSFGTSVTPTRLSIDFRADDRLELDTDLLMRGLGQSGEAAGRIRAGIRYDAPYVYLRDIDAGDLEIVLRTDPEASQTLSDLSTVIRDTLRQEREELTTSESKAAFDRLARTAAMNLAGSIPIYDLRDAGLKGSVAALALDGVRFDDESATLTLSPRAALLRILAFLSTVALVLTYLCAGPIANFFIGRALDELGPNPST